MCSAFCACGSAMFTMDASRMIISCAPPMTARASHLWSGPERAGPAAVAGSSVVADIATPLRRCGAIPCEQPVGGLTLRRKRKQPPLNLPEAPSVLSTDLADEYFSEEEPWFGRRGQTPVATVTGSST